MNPEFIGHNLWIVALLVLWSTPWKALALWKSARNNDKWWFVVLLFVQTLGILDILYIYIFSKRERLNETR